MFSKEVRSNRGKTESAGKKWGIYFFSALLALAMVYAVGADWTVQRPALPEARSLWGYAYQLLARTSAAFTMEPLTAAERSNRYEN